MQYYYCEFQLTQGRACRRLNNDMCTDKMTGGRKALGENVEGGGVKSGTSSDWNVTGS